MTKSEALYTGAYVVRGNAQALGKLLLRLEKDGIVRHGNPDVYARSYRSFGIDDAYDLRERSRSRPVSLPRRVFALSVPSMTTEAQNALLKTLEEPSADALFFLVVPSPEMLLPTIRSRVQILDIEESGLDTIVDMSEFLAAPIEKRLLLLKPLYEHEDEGRDIGSVIAFLQALEHRFAKSDTYRTSAAAVHALYRARKYATDKGSLLKSLLEHVAFMTPKNIVR